jgi:tRNA-dihydrouridine synthase B
VTLKMRTGWCEAQKNALSLARAAESAGVQMVTLAHRRTCWPAACHEWPH